MTRSGAGSPHRRRARTILAIACTATAAVAMPATARPVTFADRVGDAPAVADVVSLTTTQQGSRLVFRTEMREVADRETQVYLLIELSDGRGFTFGAVPRPDAGWVLLPLSYLTDSAEGPPCDDVFLGVDTGDGGTVRLDVPRACVGEPGDAIDVAVLARDVGIGGKLAIGDQTGPSDWLGEERLTLT